VDLVILVDSPEKYLNAQVWLGRFGELLETSIEDWGVVKSLRVWYVGGLEVEFGFTTETWLSSPLDAGTKQVLSEGFHFLVNKRRYDIKLSD